MSMTTRRTPERIESTLNLPIPRPLERNFPTFGRAEMVLDLQPTVIGLHFVEFAEQGGTVFSHPTELGSEIPDQDVLILA